MKLKILMVVGDLATEKNPSFQPFVKSQIESIEARGHTVEIFNIQGPKFGGNFILKTIPLFNFVRKFKPDIVHAHYSYSGFTSLSTLPLNLVISFMGDDVLGDFNTNGKKTLRSYLHKPVAVVASKGARAIIVKSKEMTNYIKHKNIYVIPNGVDFNTFFPIEKQIARAKLGLDLNKKYILFPGDIYDPRKRFILAKESVDKLKEKFNVEVDILYMRTKPQQILNLYFNACDALIFTSWSEGSPNVIKEAMASNTPIISVDVGDTRDVISNSINCHIVNDNPDNIAEKLLMTLKDGGRSNGRNLINHLEISNIAKLIESVYFSIVKNSNARK